MPTFRSDSRFESPWTCVDLIEVLQQVHDWSTRTYHCMENSGGDDILCIDCQVLLDLPWTLGLLALPGMERGAALVGQPVLKKGHGLIRKYAATRSLPRQSRDSRRACTDSRVATPRSRTQAAVCAPLSAGARHATP